MSSLTNQQANTKSLTGLSDTYSTNIVCDTFECSQQFTIDPGCVITLPANSIPDSALSTNVAFRNQNNTFSLTNIFSSIVQFTSTTIPIITQSIPANDATTKIPTTAWTDTYFGKLTLPLATNIQTWFGQNRFSNSGANLPIILRNTDQPTYNGGMFIVNSNGSFNANNILGDTCLISLGTNATNTGALSLTTWSNTDCGIRITLNNVRINGTTSTINSACSFTSTTTPVITQSISLADNSTKIATTAFVKGQNYITASALTPYALLAGPQTFTGDQNFVTQAIANNSTLVATTAFVKNQNYITSTALTPYALLAPTSLQTFAGTGENTFNNRVNINDEIRFVDSFSSKISQVSNALVIENISNLNSVQIRSTTAGLVQRTGLLIENGITCTLQGGSGNTITITGLNTPTLGIPPLAGVYSSEIATTSWVNSELTGVYASLNATQTFTAQNTFTTAVPTPPIVITNTVSTNSGGLLLSGAGDYNGINNAGDFAVIGFGPSIDTGILNLTTWANGFCGIKIDNDTITQNAPFTCGYLQLGGPITSKTNFNIGYQWDIGGAAFTGTGWSTAVGAYNIMTIAWDGTGDKTLGVWMCEIVIITNCSSAPSFSLCWNTISATSMDISEKCTQSNVTTVFNAASHQICRLNFTLNITNFLGNYFLNSNRVGGAALFSNLAFSQIKFTRIA